MSDLLGVIAPLKKFLSNTDESISVPVGNMDQEILSLSKGRTYLIPDFQREIRWESENVSQLIDDISSGPKYLGNVILTRHTGQKFSIIDGQQRITILTMVLSCLMSRHNSRMEVFAPCQLLIESFSEFWNLLGRGFAAEELEKTENAKDFIRERAEAYDALQNSPESAATRGYVDGIILPAATRKRVIAAFDMLATKRETGIDKKHGTL